MKIDNYISIHSNTQSRYVYKLAYCPATLNA